MPETLYIVIYEALPGKWMASSHEPCTTEEQALKVTRLFSHDTGMRYAYVKGPICSPEAMAEASASIALASEKE